jgi:hypothetical protein
MTHSDNNETPPPSPKVLIPHGQGHKTMENPSPWKAYGDKYVLPGEWATVMLAHAWRHC